MSEEADTESTTPAVVAPAEPTAEVTFSQEQVNALLAKERATATRKAKQTPKAPTKEQPQNVPNDAIAMLTEQVSALTGLVQASTDKQIAQEASNAFIADTASLNISDTDKAVLKTLKEHSPETYQAKLKEYRSVDNPPDPKGPGHITPGANVMVTRRYRRNARGWYFQGKSQEGKSSTTRRTRKPVPSKKVN